MHKGTTGITITLPGVADQLVADSGWRQDYPDYYEQYECGQAVRAGRGWRYTVTLSPEVHESLMSYLDSRLGALESMTNEERGQSGNSEMRALRRVLR